MLRILLGLRLSRSPGLHPHAGELSHGSLLFSSGVPSVPKRPEEKLYLFLVLQLSLDCQHNTQGKTCLGQLFLVPFHPSDLCPLMFYCVMLHSCSHNLTNCPQRFGLQDHFCHYGDKMFLYSYSNMKQYYSRFTHECKW